MPVDDLFLVYSNLYLIQRQIQNTLGKGNPAPLELTMVASRFLCIESAFIRIREGCLRTNRDSEKLFFRE